MNGEPLTAAELQIIQRHKSVKAAQRALERAGIRRGYSTIWTAKNGRPKPSGNTAWTPAEDEVLRKAKSPAEAYEMLAGKRTRGAVKGRFYVLRTDRRRRPWEPWEDSILRNRYPEGGVSAVREGLKEHGSRRSDHGIRNRARLLDVTHWRYLPSIEPLALLSPLSWNPREPRTEYEKRRALFHLAESNPTPAEYEAERARILEGKT